jgi:GNAT superfamily N-acetyltransferase
MSILLLALQDTDVDQFVLDNQEAFRYGAMEEFGLKDDHFEEDGQIISRTTILHCIKNGIAYRIVAEGQVVGGLVVSIEHNRGHLDLLFVAPDAHDKGIGYAAWCAIENMYPQVKVWETHTPYFEKRNIHFYVNRCGFHIVEFYNSHHRDENDTNIEKGEDFDGMFRFEKRIEST